MSKRSTLCIFMVASFRHENDLCKNRVTVLLYVIIISVTCWQTFGYKGTGGGRSFDPSRGWAFVESFPIVIVANAMEFVERMRVNVTTLLSIITRCYGIMEFSRGSLIWTMLMIPILQNTFRYSFVFLHFRNPYLYKIFSSEIFFT